MARDMMVIEGAPMDLKLRRIASRIKDAHRYNVLTVDEIAALMVGDHSEAIDRTTLSLLSKLAHFSAFPNYMWDTWLYIIHCYFLTVRMDGIQILCSMVLLLMQIWMKTMRENLSFKENITM
jgi:hypothetical protein